MSALVDGSTSQPNPKRSPPLRNSTAWQPDGQPEFYHRYNIQSAPPTTINFPLPPQGHHQEGDDTHYALAYNEPAYTGQQHSRPRDSYHYLPTLQMPPQDYQPYPIEQGYARPIPFKHNTSALSFPGAYALGDRHDGSMSPGSVSPCPSTAELGTSPHSYSGHMYPEFQQSPASSVPPHSASSLPNMPSAYPYLSHPLHDDRPGTASPALSGRQVEDAKPFAQKHEEQPDRLPQGTPFISKLLHLLNNDKYRDYIRWTAAGDAFILSHTNTFFALEVLPIYFRHTNTSSFVRQLNLYGFQRLPIMQLLETLDIGSALATHDTPSSCFSGFSHPYLQRDNQELSKLIKPKASSKPRERSGSAKASSANGATKPRANSKSAVPKGTKPVKRSSRDDSEPTLESTLDPTLAEPPQMTAA